MDGQLRTVVEQGPVGQAGERIVIGQPLNPLFRRLVAGGLGEDAQVLNCFALCVANGADDEPLGVNLAGTAAVPDLAFPASGTGDLFPHGLVEGRILAAGLQHFGRFACQVVHGVAGDRGEGLVHRYKAPGSIGNKDAFLAGLKNVRHQRRLRLRFALLGHIQPGTDDACALGGFVAQQHHAVIDPAVAAVLVQEAVFVHSRVFVRQFKLCCVHLEQVIRMHFAAPERRVQPLFGCEASHPQDVVAHKVHLEALSVGCFLQQRVNDRRADVENLCQSVFFADGIVFAAGFGVFVADLKHVNQQRTQCHENYALERLHLLRHGRVLHQVIEQVV